MFERPTPLQFRVLLRMHRNTKCGEGADLVTFHLKCGEGKNRETDTTDDELKDLYVIDLEKYIDIQYMTASQTEYTREAGIPSISGPDQATRNTWLRVPK